MSSMRCSFKGWRSRLPLLAAVMGSGLLFGLIASNGALAQDPEPTTVPTPTLPAPDPAPDPAPEPKPAPKPKPKAKPKPAPRQPAPQPPAPEPSSSSSSDSFSPPVRSAPRVRSQPKRAKKAPARPKRKKVVQTVQVKPNPAIEAKRAAEMAVPVRGIVGERVGFVNRPATSGGSFDVASLLVIFGCTLGIACLAVAAIPPTFVPWRSAAIFVSDNQFAASMAGVALLLAALFTLIWSQGS